MRPEIDFYRRVLLAGPTSRKTAAWAIEIAPDGHEMVIREPPSTPPQIKRFWAACTALAHSTVKWANAHRSKDEWHDLLLWAYLTSKGHRGEFILGLEGERLMLRPSIKRLSEAEMAELIDYTNAFCAQHGVELME